MILVVRMRLRDPETGDVKTHELVIVFLDTKH